MNALPLLSKPLLTISDIASLPGAGIHSHISAHLLRYYADYAQQFGGTDLAMACLMQAIEINPDEPETYLELYYVFESAQQGLVAIEWMLNAQVRFPSNAPLPGIMLLSMLYKG